MQAISATKTVVAGAGNSSERYADSGMGMLFLLAYPSWSDSEARQRQRVCHAWSDAPSVLTREFDARHPLGFGSGSRGLPACTSSLTRLSGPMKMPAFKYSTWLTSFSPGIVVDELYVGS